MPDLEILFENEDMLVLNKPSGLIVHPDGKREESSVVDFLLKNFPNIRDVGEPIISFSGEKILRSGIVHRIDKETSGALIIAKTEEAYLDLKNQFQNREIKKTYHAFVYGSLNEERGVIDKPIGRSIAGVRKWAVGNNIRGEAREAITKFKVVKKKQESSFLEIWPLTGRTHQIRVHLNSIHHSIVADPLYSPKKPEILGFHRLALHASKVIFKDIFGKEREIVAPFPEDFKKALKDFEIPEFSNK